MRNLFLTLVAFATLFVSCDKDSQWELDQQRKIEGLQSQIISLSEKLKDATASLQDGIDSNTDDITANAEAINAANTAIAENLNAIALLDEALTQEVLDLYAEIGSTETELIALLDAAVISLTEAIEAGDIANAEALDAQVAILRSEITTAQLAAQAYADANDAVGITDVSDLVRDIAQVQNNLDNQQITLLLADGFKKIEWTDGIPEELNKANLYHKGTGTGDRYVWVDSKGLFFVALVDNDGVYHDLKSRATFAGVLDAFLKFNIEKSIANISLTPGPQGAPGKDGSSVTVVSVVSDSTSTTVLFSDSSSLNIPHGVDGTNGTNGAPGAPGDSFDASKFTVTSVPGDGFTTVTIHYDGNPLAEFVIADGATGPQGPKGDAGDDSEDTTVFEDQIALFNAAGFTEFTGTVDAPYAPLAGHTNPTASIGTFLEKGSKGIKRIVKVTDSVFYAYISVKTIVDYGLDTEHNTYEVFYLEGASTYADVANKFQNWNLEFNSEGEKENLGKN